MSNPEWENYVRRPRVVTLCGSTRFHKEFQKANYEETMAGRIVLSVGFYPHSLEVHGEGVGCTPEQKAALDELHKRKIDLSDEILVLNVGGYVGESTRSEIEYAKSKGKRVRWLEGEGDAAGEQSGKAGTADARSTPVEADGAPARSVSPSSQAVECEACYHECKVCANKPDEDGRLEHGRGCYTQSEDGGGEEWFDHTCGTATSPPSEPDEKCPRCGWPKKTSLGKDSDGVEGFARCPCHLTSTPSEPCAECDTLGMECQHTPAPGLRALSVDDLKQARRIIESHLPEEEKDKALRKIVRKDPTRLDAVADPGGRGKIAFEHRPGTGEKK